LPWGILLLLGALIAAPFLALDGAAQPAASNPKLQPPPMLHALPFAPDNNSTAPTGPTALFYAAPVMKNTSLEPGLYVDPNGPCPTCAHERFTPKPQNVSTLDETDTFGAVGAALAVAVRADGRVIAVSIPSYPTSNPDSAPQANANAGLPPFPQPRVVLFAPNGTVLAIAPVNASELRWAPDGSYLVASVGNRLVKINLDGDNSTLYTGPVGSQVRGYFLAGNLVVDDPGAGFTALVSGPRIQNVPVPPELVSPSGAEFLEPAGATGGILAKDFSTGQTRLIDASTGHFPVGWGPAAILYRFTDANGHPRYGFETDRGQGLGLGDGYNGTPVKFAWSPNGTEAAVEADPPLFVSVRSIDIQSGRILHEDDPGAVVLSDLEWGRLAAPPHATDGTPFRPMPKLFAAAGDRFFELIVGDANLTPGVYSVAADGSDPVLVVRLDFRPSHGLVSGPGPSQMSFVGPTGAIETISLLGPVDQEPFVLLNFSGFGSFFPQEFAFSPDGNRVAVTMTNGAEYRLALFVNDHGNWTFVRDVAVGPIEEEGLIFDGGLEWISNSDIAVPLSSATWILNVDTREVLPIDVLPPSTIDSQNPAQISLSDVQPNSAAGLFVYRWWFAASGAHPLGERQVLAQGFEVLASQGDVLLLLNESGDVFVLDTQGGLHHLTPDPPVTAAVLAPDNSGATVFFANQPPEFFALSSSGVPTGSARVWPSSTFTAATSTLGSVATLLPLPPPPSSLPAAPVTSPTTTAATTGTTTGATPVVFAQGQTTTVSGKVAIALPAVGPGSKVTLKDSAGNPVGVVQTGNKIVWDTTVAEDGYYSLTVTDSTGQVVQTQTFLVHNVRTTPRRFAETAAIGVVATVGLAALLSSTESTIKGWLLSQGETNYAARIGRKILLGGAGVAPFLTGGVLLGFTATYSNLNGWSLSQYLSLLPIVGLAVFVAFAADYFFDRAFARLEGREVHYKIHLPGVAALLVTTFAFGTPFGAPGSTEGADIEDPRVAGHRGVFSFLHLLALLLPFSLLAGWRYIVFETGAATVVMLAVNAAFPMGELPGKAVWKWNRWIWLGIFVLLAALFVAAVFGPSPVWFALIGLGAIVALVVRFVRIEELKPRRPADMEEAAREEPAPTGPAPGPSSSL
jgi:hypothetical protein